MPIPKIPPQARKLLMEKLFGWSPERQALKEEVLPTMEKVFKEHGAGIKRGFIMGSSVTPKVNPTDIDLLLQTKPDFDVKLMREMQKHFHEIPQKEGQTILDVVEMSKRAALGIPEEMKGKLHIAWQGSRPWKDVAKEATEFGRVERGYGKNYRLKRILGVTGAATVGGLLAREPKEAEAISLKSIGKILKGVSVATGKKISRREFLKGLRPPVPKLGQAEREQLLSDVVKSGWYSESIYADQALGELATFLRDEKSAKAWLPHYKKLLSNEERSKFVKETDKYFKIVNEGGEPSFFPDKYLNSVILSKLKPTREEMEKILKTVVKNPTKRELDYIMNLSVFRFNQKGKLIPTEEFFSYLQPATEKLLEASGNALEKGLKKEVTRREFLTGSWLKKVGKPAVGGAVGVGALLGSEQQSEAMPFLSIKPTSAVSKMFRGISSSAKALTGETFAGKTIKNVHQGAGKTRYVEFTDGTTQVSDTEEVNILARAAGHGRYEKKFQEAGKKEREAMATSALEDRLSRPAIGSPHYEREHQLFIDKIRAIDPTRVPKTVIVRYPKNDQNARLVQMREDYAKILEEKGIVTIIGKPQ